MAQLRKVDGMCLTYSDGNSVRKLDGHLDSPTTFARCGSLTFCIEDP